MGWSAEKGLGVPGCLPGRRGSGRTSKMRACMHAGGGRVCGSNCARMAVLERLPTCAHVCDPAVSARCACEYLTAYVATVIKCPV